MVKKISNHIFWLFFTTFVFSCNDSSVDSLNQNSSLRSLHISPTKIVKAFNSSLQYTVYGVTAQGDTIEVVADGYFSTNSDIVEIESNGRVAFLDTGNTYIYAEFENFTSDTSLLVIINPGIKSGQSNGAGIFFKSFLPPLIYQVLCELDINDDKIIDLEIWAIESPGLSAEVTRFIDPVNGTEATFSPEYKVVADSILEAEKNVPNFFISPRHSDIQFWAEHLEAGKIIDENLNWTSQRNYLFLYYKDSDPQETTYFSPTYGQWQTVQPGHSYIGIRLKISDGFTYGWLNVSLNGEEIRIHSLAIKEISEHF